ncbi:MAG: hypothetical protein WDZ35_06870 [Crocinitomicaceae bacterium]
MPQISFYAKNVVDLLDGNDQKKGDLSYRLEGTCLAVMAVSDIFSEDDRKIIEDAIKRAFSRFGQRAAENRFALQVLQHFNSL